MLFSALSFAALLGATPTPGASALAVSRNPIVSGDPVSLIWYVTGEKVTLTGGRFGAGTVVTGKTNATDQPKASTKYMLDIWYKDDAGKLLHSQYAQTVEVLNPVALGWKTYSDTRGWRLLHPKEWKCDKVTFPDPGSNALMYFQEEDDALERLAVAVLPVTEQSCASLVKRIEADLPSHYDDVQVLSRQEITFENVPAMLTVVSGKDQSHFGARTNSVILVFVRSNLGYVISGRTAANKFTTRQPFLTRLVKSFAFLSPQKVGVR